MPTEKRWAKPRAEWIFMKITMNCVIRYEEWITLIHSNMQTSSILSQTNKLFNDLNIIQCLCVHADVGIISLCSVSVSPVSCRSLIWSTRVYFQFKIVYFMFILIFIDAMRCFHLNKHRSVLWASVRILLKFYLMMTSLEAIFQSICRPLSLSICHIILVRATKVITKCKVYLFRRIQTEWNKTKIVQMFKIVVHPVELSHIRGCG